MRWGLVALIALIASASAGCLTDLERAGLVTRWDGAAVLAEGPVLQVNGWPSMLVIDGEIHVAGAGRVELTSVLGRLMDDDEALVLRPVLLTIGENTIHPGESRDDAVYMGDGDRVRATFVPGASTVTRVTAGDPLEIDAELRWRYSEGDRFDAGRFEFNENVTVTAAPGLGYGVTDVRDGLVRAVVFQAIGADVAEADVDIASYAVRRGGVEELTRTSTRLERGEGVVIAELEPALAVPDGEGYVIVRVEGRGIGGAAVAPLAGGQERTPAPGVAGALLALTLALCLLRGRRSRSCQ